MKPSFFSPKEGTCSKTWVNKKRKDWFIRMQYPHPNKDAKNEKEHIKVLHCLHFFKIPEIKGISKPGLVIEFYIISKIC